MLALSKSWWVFSCLDGIHADSFSEFFSFQISNSPSFFLPFFPSFVLVLFDPQVGLHSVQYGRCK